MLFDPRQSLAMARALAFSLLASSAAGANNGVSTLQGLETGLKGIYERRAGAVVRVNAATESTDEDGKPVISRLVQSGFFISKTGKVLSNSVPSKETSRVWIEKDRVSYLADIVGSDPRSNVSLLQVINLPADFDYIDLAEGTDPLQVGSLAVAITSPLDFAPSPNLGMAIGFESSFAEWEFPLTFTRLNIPIGGAEGGSPVFDIQGDLAGIVFSTLPEVLSSYIVPTPALKRIADSLERDGKMDYGVLPITFEEKTNVESLTRQVFIKTVVPESPAARAGVQPRDVVSLVDGRPIKDLNTLRNLIFHKNPGEFLLLKVQRRDKELEFAILLEPEEDHIGK